MNKFKWHKWFAWHPVRINNKLVWLKDVERHGYQLDSRFDFEWVYRHIGEDTEYGPFGIRFTGHEEL